MYRTTTLVVALLTVALLLALGHGCFAPDLGETPFRCAKRGKPCPDGYRCNSTNICVSSSSAASTGDADGTLPDLGLPDR